MRRINPDKSKAKSLIKMSNRTIRRIQKTDFEEFPSQVLKNYYSSIKLLMEASSSLEGRIEGRGYHKKIIDWATDKYNFSEGDRNFLQDLRRNRNKIS